MHVSKICAAFMCALAASGASTAQAAITVLKANGQPVPAGTSLVWFDPSTGGWHVSLLSLYDMWSNTVYEVHANGGEIIDSISILPDGPVAGSPLIVRAISDPPGGLHSVLNIVQFGTAETLLNQVTVTHDIGSIQVQAIGNLVAGRDIIGPIHATTPNNAVRGITTAQAGRHILGDLTAPNGRILVVSAQENIGSPPPAKPISVIAKHNVGHVVGKDINANINARANGGTGGMFVLQADRFFGSLEIEKLLYNSAVSSDGKILIGQSLQGDIVLGKHYDNPAQIIQTPLQGLHGQIIINADNAPPTGGSSWTAPVRIGPTGNPQTITLNAPNYAYKPADLGGGSIAAVPYGLHATACVPANGATASLTPSAAPLQVSLQHYGPIVWNTAMGAPVTIERRIAGGSGSFSPVPNPAAFAFQISEASPNVLKVGSASTAHAFSSGFEYRIRATAALRCAVPSQPAVVWPVDYQFTVTALQCPGDLNLSGHVDVSDLVILLGFWGPVSPVFPGADINGDGVVSVDDLVIMLSSWGSCKGG